MDTRNGIRLALATVIATFCVVFQASAAEVSADEAAYAVDAWVARGGTLGARLGGVMRVDAHSPANGAKFYAVKTAGGGTVFTSSDTEEEPIVAFTSATDDFSKIDEKSPLWAILARERRMAPQPLMTAAKSAAPGQSAAVTKWSKLIAEGKARAAAAANGLVFPAKSGLPSVGDVRVAPLLQTKWHQTEDGAGAPCYNYYTPNGFCCGCVATAMSQIMCTHRFPSASVTPVTKECFVSDSAADYTMYGGVYNWNAMPLEPNAKVCTEAERRAIGRLTYDAGISVCMDWGVDGSGAMACLVGDAFRDVFGYGQAVYYKVNDGLGDGVELQKAVYSNLDAGYPVMFGICYSNWRDEKSNGHSIVGDGYGYNNGTAYVHLNMGWSGQYDLWYVLPEIDTPNSYFNWIEDITYNIFPRATAETAAFSGRALLPNGKPAVGATVKIYCAGDNAFVTNLSVNAAGVWGTLVEAGTYNVDVELASCGFFGAASNVSVAAASTYSKSFNCAIDAAGRITRQYDCTRYVSYEGNLGNRWGNDITVTGEITGTPLVWTEPQTLAATQLGNFEHAFAVTGGDAPYSWSVGASYAFARDEGSTFDGESGTAPFTYQDFEGDGASVVLPFAVLACGKLGDRIVANTDGSAVIGDLQVRIDGIWCDASRFYVATSDHAVTLRWDAAASLTLTDDGSIRVAYNLPASSVTVEDRNTSELFAKFEPADVGETNADVVFAPSGLPPGLTLNAATGVLSGCPQVDGESTFTVTVLDVGGQTLSRDFTLVVSPSANAKPVINGCKPSADGHVDAMDGEEITFFVYAQDAETPKSDLVYTWEIDGNEVGSFKGSNGIIHRFSLNPENPVESRRHAVVCYVSDGVWTRQVKQVWNVRIVKVSYVDASAEEDWDVMDGSSEHPWTQISYATGYASAGDIVYVRPGTYEPFGGENCEIKVIALGGPSVTIVDGRGENQCYTCYGGAYDEELGMEVYGRKPRLEGFTFLNGRQGYGGAAGVNGGTLVNCIIKNCSAARVDEWSSFCIGGAYSSMLVNCVIAGCSGEDAGAAFNCELCNCTVVNNGSRNGPAGIDSRSAAYNTVFWSNDGEIAAKGAVLEDCLTNADPLLSDPANGDYRLRAGSPCIDAGSNAWLVEGVTNDLAGAERVQNGIVDIGAYEGAGVEPPVGGLPELPENPTAEDVETALEGVTFADDGVKGMITGAVDPIAAYNEFKAWAGTVPGGETTVLESPRAAVSFAFGAADLFQDDPKPEITAASVEPTEDGTGVEIAVTIRVKDGENVMAVASAKVSEMFEATSDLTDWDGAGKLTPTVTDLTQDTNLSVSFKVKPGDGTSKCAFLRIRR